MSMKRITQVLCAAAVLGVAGMAAPAQVDTSFTYQGQLFDAGALADGIYDIRFRVFDASVGGAQVGATLTRNNVPVSDGVFTTDLDFGALPDDNLWLRVEVRPGASGGGYTVLSPRQELTAAPFAAYSLDLRLPFVRTASDGTSLFELTNTAGGRVLTADKTVPSGLHTVRADGMNNTTAVAGFYSGGTNQFGLHVTGNGTGSAISALGDGANVQIANDLYAIEANGDVDLDNGTGRIWMNLHGTGANFWGYDDDDNATWYIDEDVSGRGGYFQIYGDTGSFTVDGNSGGSPTVSASGSGSSWSMRTSVSGDSSVNLPTGSVNSTETSNEPGVASATNGSGSDAITSTTNLNIISRTISAPSSGYVLVIASFEASFHHSSGTTSSYNLGVSDISATLPSNQDVELYRSSSLPSGQVDTPVTVHGLFSVSAGNNTFYLVGRKGLSTSPTCTIYDQQFSLVFIPTAYGGVNPTLMAPPGMGEDHNAVPDVPLGAKGILAERAMSIADNNARLQAELDETRARQAELIQRLDALEREQKQGHEPKKRPAGDRPSGAEEIALDN